ncbi:MAG: response regulator [bacterium]|nr:response regulator [bacterium]
MPESKNRRVLIIDDDQFLLNMYSIKFKKSGFDVDVAVGGNDALTKLREGINPDVILLDLVMPEMDGLELLENIRKEKLAPQAKVIILSNQNHPSDAEKAKNLGITKYLVKASRVPSEVVAEVIKVVNTG